MAPLALLSLVYSRKKKRGKLDTFIILLVLGVALSMSLSACGGTETPPPTVIVIFTTTPGQIVAHIMAGNTVIANVAIPTSTPTETATPPPTIIFTQTTSPTPNCASTCKEDDNTLDQSELSGRVGKFYKLYKAMEAMGNSDHTKWWWKDYGDDGCFSIWDFMAIMWSYDAQLNIKEVKEAMHNRAALFCPDNCDPKTAIGSLSYLAGYAQSARDRVDRWQEGSDPSKVMDESVSDKQLGLDIMEGVKSSTGQGLNAMSPFDYGNISLNRPVYGKMVTNGWVVLYRSADNGDTFFVLSRCQYYFAQAVITSGLQLNQGNYEYYCH